MQPMEQQTLEDIRKKFEQWRHTRKNRRERIPSHLWQSAAELTKFYSLNRVAQTLRLNSNDLRRQMKKYNKQTTEASLPSSDFVELACDFPFPSTAECVVELADQQGSQMRISIKGSKAVHVQELIKSFWKKDQ